MTTQVIEYCAAARRLRLTYRPGTAERPMEVDPWAVVLRHSLWYLLCWSHTRQARRVLRVDRIVAIEALPATFTPPPDLDALRVLEEHLSQGGLIRLTCLSTPRSRKPRAGCRKAWRALNQTGRDGRG